jgi:hypothetical protein
MTSFRQLVVQMAGVCLCAALFAGSLWLVYLLTLHSSKTLVWNRYGFSDILIDYQAGFIRRGLLGAWIRRLSGGGPELPAANLIVFTNFALLVTSLTLLALRTGRQRLWNTLLVLGAPGSVFAMSVAREFFYRKEIFFCSTLAVCGLALSLFQDSSSRAARRLAAACLLGAIVLLSLLLSLVHEGFLFLSAPAYLFLLLAAARMISSPQTHTPHAAAFEKRLTWAYAGAMLLLFLCLGYFRGGPQAAETIWNGLNPQDRAMIGPKQLSAIAWIGHSLAQLLSEPVAVLISGMAWFWLVPACGLMLYSLTLVGLNLDAGAGQKERGQEFYGWVVCYLTLAVCSLPIYVPGRDWGRWMNCVNLSFLILWMSIPRPLLARIVPQRWTEDPRTEFYLGRFRGAVTRYGGLVARHKTAAALAMFFFAMTFRFPESILEPSDPRYILYLGVHSLWSVMHRHRPT